MRERKKICWPHSSAVRFFFLFFGKFVRSNSIKKQSNSLSTHSNHNPYKVTNKEKKKHRYLKYVRQLLIDQEDCFCCLVIQQFFTQYNTPKRRFQSHQQHQTYFIIIQYFDFWFGIGSVANVNKVPFSINLNWNDLSWVMTHDIIEKPNINGCRANKIDNSITILRYKISNAEADLIRKRNNKNCKYKLFYYIAYREFSSLMNQLWK